MVAAFDRLDSLLPSQKAKLSRLPRLTLTRPCKDAAAIEQPRVVRALPGNENPANIEKCLNELGVYLNNLA
jgi:hypothetical protein